MPQIELHHVFIVFILCLFYNQYIQQHHLVELTAEISNLATELNRLKSYELRQKRVNEKLQSDVKYLLGGMQNIGESLKELKNFIQDQDGINNNVNKRFGELRQTVFNLETKYHQRNQGGGQMADKEWKRSGLKDVVVYAINRAIDYIAGSLTGLFHSFSKNLLN